MVRLRRKPINPDITAKQHDANKALAISQQIEQELDELERVVNEKVSNVRRLNRENNFAARVEMAYRGQGS